VYTPVTYACFRSPIFSFPAMNGFDQQNRGLKIFEMPKNSTLSLSVPLLELSLGSNIVAKGVFVLVCVAVEFDFGVPRLFSFLA